MYGTTRLLAMRPSSLVLVQTEIRFTRNRTLSSRSYPSNLHQFTFVETKPSFIPRSLQRRTIECVDSIRLGEKRCITTNRKVGCIEHGMFWPVLVFSVFFPMRTKRSVERNRRWRARADRLVSGISAMTFTTMSMQNKSSVPNGRCVRHRCVQTNTSSLSLLCSIRMSIWFISPSFVRSRNYVISIVHPFASPSHFIRGHRFNWERQTLVHPLFAPKSI